MDTGYRKYINRDQVRETGRDLESTYNWELQVVDWPNAVYYPGDGVFKTRLREVTAPQDPQITPIEEKLHGFTILDYGDVDRSGELSFQFLDRIDKSIDNIFVDWNKKIEDPETKLAYPREDLVISVDLFQLNKANYPVKVWHCRGGILQSYNNPATFSGEKTVMGNIDVTIQFEHIVREILT